MTTTIGTERTRVDWRPLVACCLATFLLLLYTTVATVSVTTIERALHAGYATGQWVIDAYTLALAALLLAIGSLGDRVGHRRIFLTGLALFGLATLACGLAWTGWSLVAARAVQGVGGAALLASTIPLLARRYTGRDRGRAFAVWGAVAGAGGLAGTIAGGLVIHLVSWRWLFLASLPICAVAAVVGAASLPRPAGSGGRLDGRGAAVITVATTALTFAVINAGEHGARSAGTIGGLSIAVAAAIALAPVERRAAQPILPPPLFATSAFGGVLSCAFGYYFAAFAALPVVSGWLQGSGLSSVRAALVLSIQLVAFTGCTLLVSARLHTAPTAWVLGGGTVLTGLASLAAGWVWAVPTWWALLPALIGTGLGAGLVSPVLPAVAATTVPAEHAGTGGAAANSARQLGLTVGVAVCGAVAHRQSTAPAHGVVLAFAGCAAVALVTGLLGVLLLRRPTGGPRRRSQPVGVADVSTSR